MNASVPQMHLYGFTAWTPKPLPLPLGGAYFRHLQGSRRRICCEIPGSHSSAGDLCLVNAIPFDSEDEGTTIRQNTETTRQRIPEGLSRAEKFTGETGGVCLHYTGLFISPSGISELDCATTNTDMAERSISIGRESLQVFFFVLEALAYFQVPPLGGSREEKWRSQ